MRQLTFVGPGKLEWWDVPDPTIETALDAIVRPLAVARCDLDRYIAGGIYPVAGSFAFGHEMAGEVVHVGDDVSSVRPGDRVVVPFQLNCGACAPCRRGRTAACASVPFGAAYGLAPLSGHEAGGALSDLVRVPFADAMLVPVPAELPLTTAAGLADNVADGYRTVAQALAAHPHADVLVIGGLASSVGLYAVQSAAALGAERVVYADPDAARRGLAAELGADAVATDYRERVGRFPVVVDASALPDGLGLAIQSTAPGGWLTCVSSGVSETARLPLRAMYTRGIRFDISRVDARATLPAVLEQVTGQRLDPSAVPTRVLRFDDAPEAMAEPDVKLVFTRNA